MRYLLIIFAVFSLLLPAAASAADTTALELPEQRYMGSFGIGLIDGLSLAVKYAHDKDYDESDGGTDDSADSVTMQLALEF